MKKPFVLILLMCLFWMMCFTEYAQAQDKKTVRVVMRSMNGELMVEDQDLDNLEISAHWFGYGMSERYPTWEVVTIGGIPWQDTKYAQVIKDNLFSCSGGYLSKHPELVEIILDKRFNGKGHIVTKLYSEGKSVAEIKEALLKNENTNTNTNNTPSLPEADGKKKAVLLTNSQDCSLSDGQTWMSKKLDASPMITSGRMLIPIRGVLDFMGAALDWNAGARQVTAKLGSKEVVLTINSRTALVNGKTVTLDAPARAVNGRTLIPLRFVSEQLGLKATWDNKTGYVTVSE